MKSTEPPKIVFNFGLFNPKPPLKIEEENKEKIEEENKEKDDDEESGCEIESQKNDSPPLKVVNSEGKLFQKSIVYLELLKLNPRKIEDGFLSIESVSPHSFVILRSFSGIVHFKGLILAKGTKLKENKQELKTKLTLFV